MMLIHTFTLVRSFDRWQQITALQVHCDQHWYDFFCIPGDVSVPQKYVKVRFRFVKGLFVWLQAITFFSDLVVPPVWFDTKDECRVNHKSQSSVHPSIHHLHPFILCSWRQLEPIQANIERLARYASLMPRSSNTIQNQTPSWVFGVGPKPLIQHLGLKLNNQLAFSWVT